MPMLDVHRLRIFVTVAEEGSFTAAAQRLYLTQSAVSQHMSAFEREIGLSLLVRTSRGIELTAAGERLRQRGSRVLADVVALEQELRAFADGRQEISVGAFATAGAELLPHALKAFSATHPEVTVRLKALTAADATALRDGTIQVLLAWDYNFAPQAVDPQLDQHRLLDDPMLAVLPAAHPLSGRERIALAELAGERWVTRAHRPPYEHAYETMCRLGGFEPEVVFRTEDYQLLQGLVAAGMGVSVVPALSLVPHRADVVTRPISTPVLARRITALTLPDAHRAAPVLDFLTALTDAAETSRAEEPTAVELP